VSWRAPYEPSLERLAACVCYVLPFGKVLTSNKAAKTCSSNYETGIDPRTVDRYVTQYSNELNQSTDKKCGKKVKQECARKGFKITESLGGSLRKQRKELTSGHQPSGGLSNVEHEGLCVTELGAESNERWQAFSPLPFRRKNSLLLRQTEAHFYFRAKGKVWLQSVV
jgi:hypothetical protein